jgi:hypothetical protein
LLTSCPYVDYFRNPPEYLKDERFDEISELEKISLDGLNGFEFYQKIMKVTSRMQDSHQVFIPPFLQYYYFVLPFSIVPVDVDGEVKYQFSEFSNFTQQYVNEGGENLTGNV